MNEVAFLEAHRVVALIHAGELSARETVGAALTQIERLDPQLRAFITVRPEAALAEAAEIDARRARGERLPLQGLPLAVKDNIDTAGIRTTYGSAEFKNHVPTRDVGFVARLKEAGAIVVGKASTPEFAAYMNTRNVHVGTTRNPWAPELSSGGSSGGTAVAIATGMAALGIGTDYGGSVRLPAAFNSIVGLRGTPGRVATYPGNWPFDTFAVAGPMCRTVADVDLMLRTMSEPEPRSPLTPMTRYAGAEGIDAARLRIAWSEDLDGLFPVDPTIRVALRSARRAIEGLGLIVQDAAPQMGGIRDSIIPLRDVRTLILHSGRLDRIHEMGNTLLIASIERAKKTTAMDVARAEIARTRVWQQCSGFFDEHDVLALPATQMAGFAAEDAAPKVIDGQPIPEALDTCLSTYAITMLGWPAMSMPCGFTDAGLPVGLQLVAPIGREDRLIALGLLLERELGLTRHVPPLARQPTP